MSRAFQFRYVNEITGAFVLAAVVLLVAAVLLTARAQAWFEPKLELRLRFPPEGSEGIRKGAEVIILGTQVGNVDRVVVNDDASMEALLLIRGEFTRFIRQDSQAILKKKFGIAGDAFVEITKGAGPPLAGGELPTPARRDTEIIEIAQQLLVELRGAVLPLLEQVRRSVEEYGALAEDLRNPDGALQKLLANVEALTQDLQQGRGTAGSLLKERTTADNVNRTILSVDDTVRAVNDRVAQLQGILADIQRATGKLPAMLLQTESALREAETLIEGIQKHWLLRKYVEGAAAAERVAPEDVRLPAGEAAP